MACTAKQLAERRRRVTGRSEEKHKRTVEGKCRKILPRRRRRRKRRGEESRLPKTTEERKSLEGTRHTEKRKKSVRVSRANERCKAREHVNKAKTKKRSEAGSKKKREEAEKTQVFSFSSGTGACLYFGDADGECFVQSRSEIATFRRTAPSYTQAVLFGLF